MKDVYETIKEDNIQLRKEYLKSNSFADNDEFDDNQLEHWKSTKSLFSIKDEYNNELFPSFQFEGGKPIKIISTILEKFPDDMSQWQIALWFWVSNGYIYGDQSPQDSLNDIDGLLLAAEAESNKIIG